MADEMSESWKRLRQGCITSGAADDRRRHSHDAQVDAARG